MSKTRNLANSTPQFSRDALIVPTGNTAQRPSVTAGYIRFNTDLNTLESANSTAWANVGSGSAASGGGVSWQPVQNTSFIAVKNNGYLVNTALSNVTVTLPATPTYGDIVNITDYAGYFSSNNLILYPNGTKVQGNTSNVVVATSGASVGLVYTDTNRGWIGYNGFPSSIIGPYAIDYLLVAGGGGGAVGGGGAGGVVSGSSATVLPGTNLTVTVGSGGSGGLGSTATAGTNGGNSSLGGAFTTALGGGRGGFQNDNVGNGSGASGGSGGGASRSSTVFPTGGPGTSGQGNPGGNCNTAGPYPSGGGGGAGSSGVSGSGSQHGPGGSGTSSSISGSSVTYAGGGGGGGASNTAGSAGSGGGGIGSASAGGGNGGTNLGGGGGGSVEAVTGGSGGSGIVIIRYLGLQRASGGVVTSSGGYTVHTFTSSATFAT